MGTRANTLTWEPPLFTHTELNNTEEEGDSPNPVDDNSQEEKTTRSGRAIRPMDYYGY